VGHLDPFSSLTALSAAVASRTLSCQEITQFYLDRTAALDPALSAFVSIEAESALEAAKGHDLLLAAGVRLGALQGLPIAIKDLLHVAGTPCQAGSASRAGVAPSTADAETIGRLKRAGMVLMGRTHLVEFAFGGWGTNAAHGAPKNPWDTKTHRVPGGSSSGSGVAVGAALCPAAIGTDTGGSVRIPASFDGIVGLKPSAGQVSNAGCIPLSTTLDSIGPMTRTVADARLLHRVLSDQPWTGAPSTGRALAYLAPEAMSPVTSPAVETHYREVLRGLEAEGWSLTPLRLPFAFDDLAAASGEIIAAEAHAYHRDAITAHPDLYGPHTLARILGGARLSATDYLRRLDERARRSATFAEAMAPFDALITPTTGFTAIPLTEVDEDRPLMSSYTRPVNYLDGCAIALPSGLDDAGLPFSMQLVALGGREESLLGLAERLERFLAFSARPNLPG
jgi:aspartyl-tRNA(Asn)/glutamyl-tRNA(Gln) amidotransferase subunit A